MSATRVAARRRDPIDQETVDRSGRADPDPKRVSLGFDQTAIVEETKDPKRKYQFASLTNNRYGVRRFQNRGWEVEIEREDGPKLIIGNTSEKGEPIGFEDNVLMSIDREVWEQAEKHGWRGSGGGGQAVLDQMERARKKYRGHLDGAMPRLEGIVEIGR